MCTYFLFRNVLFPLHINRLHRIQLLVYYSQFDLELHYKAQCFSTPLRLRLPRRSQSLQTSLSHSRAFYDSGGHLYVQTTTQDIFKFHLLSAHSRRLTSTVQHFSMLPVRKLEIKIAHLPQAPDVNA